MGQACAVVCCIRLAGRAPRIEKSTEGKGAGSAYIFKKHGPICTKHVYTVLYAEKHFVCLVVFLVFIALYKSKHDISRPPPLF